jgi:hypothetical protein
MTMFDHRKNLADNRQNRTSSREMARKLYLSYPTCALIEDPETEYAIRNRFASLYAVPLTAVQIIGSAKTGFSLVKSSAFIPKTSDLDVAIIEARLFQSFWEDAYETSRGFEATRFQDPVLDGRTIIGGGQQRFLSYLQRGIIAPEYLPPGHLRQRLIADGERISASHRQHFAKISAFFYASELFFQSKQQDAVEKHWRQDLI